MIIRKKTLNKISGAEEQLAEQNVEPVQQNEAAQYHNENSEENISNEDYAQNTNYTEYPEKQNIQYEKAAIPDNTPTANKPSQENSQPVNQIVTDEDINLFDLDNIDFSQRQERRRGDRRRGFRRVDDRNLVSRAREEADAIREAALQEGYQAGLEQANADIMQLREALNEFIGTPQAVYEQIAPNILGISVEIAEKIIKKEIEQDSQVLFNTVVDVLKTLSKEEAKVTLRVSPAESNELKQHIPELIEMAGIDTKVVVLADETVSEGGCLVTTTNGIVDASVESRIEVVKQALREL
jgi:flagellar assembly protein FliH